MTPFAPGTFLRTDGLRSIRRSYRVDELAAALGESWRVSAASPFRILAVGAPVPDVIVVGAGPVGMLLAAELTRRERRRRRAGTSCAAG